MSIRFQWDSQKEVRNTQKHGVTFKAIPNRFAEQLSNEAIMVVLEPEVAAAFPTPEAVNEALRLVMRLSKIPAAQTTRRRKRKAVGA